MLRPLRILAAVLVGVGVSGFCVAAFVPAAGGRAATRVTLQVAPRGLGSVSSDPPGLDSDNMPVSECTRNLAQRACEWGYERGTTVTLTAKPDTSKGRSLASWSTPDCLGTGPCKVVVDDDFTSVVALFTPLPLAIRVSNSQAAVVTTDPAGASCREQLQDPTPYLCREFPARTRVIVTATPGSGHTFKQWSPGCEPVGPTSCAISVLDHATWVGASFDDDRLPVLPTTIRVQFRLHKRGDGTGRVTASQLDCGSQCAARYDYGSSLVLTAAPDAGSAFDGWGGVCAATQTRCTIPVGPITAIDPRFSRIPPPPTAPGSLTVMKRTRTALALSWSASTGAAGVTGYRVYVNGEAKADTAGTSYEIRGLSCGRRYTLAVDAVDSRGQRSARAETTALTVQCQLTASFTALRVTRSGRARTLVVGLRVGRAATVQMRLVRKGSAAVRHSYSVGKGASTLRLQVPAKVPGGRYTLRVKLVGRSGGTLELPDRGVRLPKSR